MCILFPQMQQDIPVSLFKYYAAQDSERIPIVAVIKNLIWRQKLFAVDSWTRDGHRDFC